MLPWKKVVAACGICSGSVYPRSKIITLFGGLDQKGMPTNKLVSKPLCLLYTSRGV